MNEEQLKFRIEYGMRELEWLRAGAKKGDEPWRNVQSRKSKTDGSWCGIGRIPRFYDDYDYRWAPRQQPVINGVQLAGQLTFKEAMAAEFVYLLGVDDIKCLSVESYAPSVLRQMTKCGLLFDTRGNADAAAAAIIAALGGEV